MLTPPIVAWIIVHFGWRAAFGFLGAGFSINAVVLYVLTRPEWTASVRDGGALLSIKPYFGVVKLPGARLVMRAVFAEALAAEIAGEVMHTAKPHSVRVELVQQPRGGITVSAVSEISK